MRRLPAASSVVVLLAALTACGGGDSGSETVADPPAVVFTPSPAVTSTGVTASPTASESPSASASSTAASGSSSGSASGSGSSEAEELTIEIKDFAFSPQTIDAKPGQKITVTNRDTATHTLTAKDGSIDSGDLGQNQSYTFTAPASGSVDYICTPHPQMTGTIKVT